MQTKYIAAIAIVVVLIVGGVFLLNKPKAELAPANGEATSTMPEGSIVENASDAADDSMMTGEVKEFTMDSWYDMATKKAHFSLSEMVVNQGDKVRVKVNNTFGMHNFVIDEYGIKKETMQGEVTTIEFVADKSGDFVFYCSKPGHRASGQWGTLKVLAQ